MSSGHTIHCPIFKLRGHGADRGAGAMCRSRVATKAIVYPAESEVPTSTSAFRISAPTTS
jgi:hypothetical protein